MGREDKLKLELRTQSTPERELRTQSTLKRELRTGAALLVLALGGCYCGAPRVPAGWRVEAAGRGPGARAGSGGVVTVAARGVVAVVAGAPGGLAGPAAARGKVEVIICYGTVLPHHTALRLECPGERPLFWDPGGTLGMDGLELLEMPGTPGAAGRGRPPERQRSGTLILKGAPTLAEYWDYRHAGCGEPWMEVFEWDLPAAEAARLRRVLLTGDDGPAHAAPRPQPADTTSDDPPPRHAFDPDYPAMFCCVGVSRFLQRCGGRWARVEEAYFWPHHLAEHLWTQQPSRVWEYRADQPARAYVKP